MDALGSSMENLTTATNPSTRDEVVNPYEVDALVAQEWKHLSWKDRTVIQEEIHGVRCLAPEETPELMEHSLQLLHQHLQRLRQPHNNLLARGFEVAQSTFPDTYLNTRETRLKFLRAELMDPQKAAVRLLKFCNLLLDIFGPESLQFPLTTKDIGVKGNEGLRAGQFQILPCRDRSGRRVFTLVGNMTFFLPLMDRIKLSIYLLNSTVDDEETQQRGVVFVAWPGISNTSTTSTSSLFLPDPKEHIIGMRLFESIPLRVVAFHACFPDTPTYHFIRSVITVIVGSHNRARMNFHTGERTEILYKLLGFGIPVDLLPLTETGNVKLKNHQAWIKVRKVKEQRHYVLTTAAANSLSSSSFDDDTIECPGLNDVAFRFGTKYMSHPGNVMFWSLIESKSEQHSRASQEEKKEITWWVIRQVKQVKHGRFLSWNAKYGSWSVITDDAQTRTKVAVCFRDQKRRVQANSNFQVTESSTYEFERQDGNKRKRLNGKEVDECNCFNMS